MKKIDFEAGDLKRSGGSWELIDEGTDTLEAMGQCVQLELATQLKGYPFDLTIGVDWVALLQSGVPDVVRRGAITQVARKQPGVIEVNGVKLTRDPSTRQAAVSLTVVGTDGAVDFNDLEVG